MHVYGMSISKLIYFIIHVNVSFSAISWLLGQFTTLCQMYSTLLLNIMEWRLLSTIHHIYMCFIYIHALYFRITYPPHLFRSSHPSGAPKLSAGFVVVVVMIFNFVCNCSPFVLFLLSIPIYVLLLIYALSV